MAAAKWQQVNGAKKCENGRPKTYAWLSPERNCGDKFLWLGRKSGRRIGRRIGRNFLRIFVLHLLYRMTHKSSPKIPPNLSLHVLWPKIWNFISASFWGLGAAKKRSETDSPKSAKTSQKAQKRSKTSENRRKSAKTILVLFVDRFLAIFQWPCSGGHLGFPKIEASEFFLEITISVLLLNTGNSQGTWPLSERV